MNLDIYTTEMSKSIWDKAFFMDKIPGTKCVIDYGCADGAMIHYLAPLVPDIMFVGFDINEELIKRARATTPFYANNVFFGDYNDVITFIGDKGYYPDELCINFSSVLHEVFSSTPEGITSIHDLVHVLDPKYITIRDMYFNGEDKTLEYFYITNVIDTMNIKEKYIEDFENTFGSICTLKGLIHFLMKYQWKDNGWDQELEEDYFSWNINEFLKLTDYAYTKIFEAHYMLPYYDNKWKDLHLLPTQVNTHAQYVFRRCR